MIPQLRLTPDDVATIQDRYLDGESRSVIARDVGVSLSAVQYRVRQATRLAGQRSRNAKAGKFKRQYRCSVCDEFGHNARTCGVEDIA